MRNVWDFREIGLVKMLFSDATAEYMEDSSPHCAVSVCVQLLSNSSFMSHVSF